MPEWVMPLLAFLAIVVFLYFASLRQPPAPPSGRYHEDGVNTYWSGGGHL
jgi:hypothetical protein